MSEATDAALDARYRAQQRLAADNYSGGWRDQLRADDQQTIDEVDLLLTLESRRGI